MAKIWNDRGGRRSTPWQGQSRLGLAEVGSREGLEDPWPGAISVALEGPRPAVLGLHRDTRARRPRGSRTNPPLFLHLPHLQPRAGSAPRERPEPFLCPPCPLSTPWHKEWALSVPCPWPLVTSMASTAKLQVPGREMYLCRVLPKVEKQPWGGERTEGLSRVPRGHREPRGGSGCRGMWAGRAEDFGSHWPLEPEASVPYALLWEPGKG